MTTDAEVVAEEVPAEESLRVGGWRAVARKEIADHILSGRFPGDHGAVPQAVHRHR